MGMVMSTTKNLLECYSNMGCVLYNNLNTFYIYCLGFPNHQKNGSKQPFAALCGWWAREGEERKEGTEGVQGRANLSWTIPVSKHHHLAHHQYISMLKCWRERGEAWLLCWSYLFIFGKCANIYWWPILQNLLSFGISTQHNFIEVMRSFSTCNYDRCKLFGQMQCWNWWYMYD